MNFFGKDICQLSNSANVVLNLVPTLEFLRLFAAIGSRSDYCRQRETRCNSVFLAMLSVSSVSVEFPAFLKSKSRNMEVRDVLVIAAVES